MSRFADGDADQREAAAGLAAGAAAGRPDAAADPLLDTVVGDVRLERVIGAGGMGRVYKGRQLRPARQVSVKVIRPGTVSPARLRWFEFEAELLGNLRDPGIAAIHAAGDLVPRYHHLLRRPFSRHARMHEPRAFRRRRARPGRAAL